MSAVTAEVLVKGKITKVPAAELGGHRVVCEGSWPRIARLFDEIWLNSSPIENPEQAIEAVRSAGIGADIFSFAQALPETAPKFSYHYDWDNLAAAPTSSFQDWWEALPQESRKNVRKSQKRGVIV